MHSWRRSWGARGGAGWDGCNSGSGSRARGLVSEAFAALRGRSRRTESLLPCPRTRWGATRPHHRPIGAPAAPASPKSPLLRCWQQKCRAQWPKPTQTIAGTSRRVPTAQRAALGARGCSPHLDCWWAHSWGGTACRGHPAAQNQPSEPQGSRGGADRSVGLARPPRPPREHATARSCPGVLPRALPGSKRPATASRGRNKPPERPNSSRGAPERPIDPGQPSRTPRTARGRSWPPGVLPRALLEAERRPTASQEPDTNSRAVWEVRQEPPAPSEPSAGSRAHVRRPSASETTSDGSAEPTGAWRPGKSLPASPSGPARPAEQLRRPAEPIGAGKDR